MTSNNAAAWFPGTKGQPLEVASSPAHVPGPGELLVRVRAVAINPVDAAKQTLGGNFLGFLPSPAILGSDVAGEVVQIGGGSTVSSRFAVGDRVVALALGMDKRGRQPDEGAFQELVVVREHLAAKLPGNDDGDDGSSSTDKGTVSCVDACVLPLALATASCGLFERDQLALSRPHVDQAARQGGNGQIVLVWGASTSVGNCAVQLAAAAGYTVVATASPRNWDAVRRLGAAHVFDYASPTAVDDIVAAMRGARSAGALAIGQGSLSRCLDVVARLDNGVKFVAQASIDVPGGKFPDGAGPLGTLVFMAGFLGTKLGLWLKRLRLGVRVKFIWATDLVDWDRDERMVFGFLEEALASGAMRASPPPLVVGEGLESVQKGFDMVREGVSGKKLVVVLPKKSR